MKTLSLTLPQPLINRLKNVAERTDRPVDECLRVAVVEFIEHWEMHLADMERMEEGIIHVALPESERD